MDLRATLEYALAREREGHAFFLERAERASHASVRAVFQRLALEELGHIGYIESLIARHGGEAADAAPQPDAGWFSARAASEMIEQTTTEAMVPDLPVLRMAWLIEQDLSAFYRAAAERTEGPARASLERLAAWEAEHERFFRFLHDRVLAEYDAAPWGG